MEFGSKKVVKTQVKNTDRLLDSSVRNYSRPIIFNANQK